MAVIPLIQPRPTLDVPQSPSPQLANPMAEVGAQIAASFQDLAAGWEAGRSIDAEAAFQQFKFDESKRYNDEAYNLKPEQAAGFAARYDAGFRERAAKWEQDNLGGVSPGEVKRWQGQLGSVRLSLADQATTTERTQQYAFATAKLDDSLNTTIAPRAAQVARLRDDANKATALAEVEADAFALIDASSLSPAQKDERKIKVREAIQTGFATALPPAEKARLDPTSPDETVVDRILSIEGTIPNSKSTAVGPGQFIDKTWLDMIKRYRPDLAQGHTDPEILALRTSPIAGELGQEMTKAYAGENSAYLQYHRLEATAGNLYLAHFLGPDGAVALLGANPDESAAKINPAAAKANPTVFYHTSGRAGAPDYNNPKTAAEVAQWAAAKMAGTYHTDWGRQLDAIPFDQRVNLGHDGSTSLIQQQTATANAAKAAYTAQLNSFQNDIDDGKAGLADIASAYSDGKGWLTDANDRLALVKRVQDRDKDVLSLASAQALMQGAAPIVSQDPKQKAAVNLWYDKLAGAGEDLFEGDGSGVTKLRATVERAEMIPDSAKAQLLSAINSPDPTRRSSGFTIMDGLYRQNPAAMAAAFTDTDLKRIDVYQRLAGIVPPEVLQEEMNPIQNPQQRQLRAARFDEGLGLARKIDTATVLGRFDNNGAWPGGGAGASGDPLMQTALRQDFENAYAEAYSRVPNEKDAQDMAVKWLGMKWGPTDVGSTGNVLMSYPPERYYPIVEGSHDWMDGQLEDAVLAQFPDASSWSLVTDPQTEADVAAKIQPSYRVIVTGQDGVYRMLGTRMRTGGPDDVTYTAEPALVRFDYQQAVGEAQARFMQRRVKALQQMQDSPFKQPLGAGETAPVSGWDQPLGAGP